MKKKIITAALLSLAVLAGCADKVPERGQSADPTSVVNADTPEDKATPTETPKAPEPTSPSMEGSDSETRPVTRFAGYESSETEILSYLDGEWVLHEGDNMIEPPDMLYDTLTFDSASHTAAYHMAYAAEEVYYDFELSDLFPEVPGQYNKLVLKESGTTPDYPYSDGNNVVELSVWLANNGGADALVIGDAGTSPSRFTADALDPGRGVGDFWYFHRPYGDNTKMTIKPAGLDDRSDVRKNSHFYALRYNEYGSGCTLQEVAVIPGGPEDERIAYGYADNAHPFSTVEYNYKGREMLAHSGGYDLDLVEVDTDGSGEITSLTVYEKTDYGYFGITASGAPDAVRDPAVYQASDESFLGEWNDGGRQETISILPADPQTGGYAVTIGFYRIGEAECYANIDGDRLSINQGFINEKPIGGVLEINEQGDLVLTITDSEFEYITPDSIYVYTVRE
ncbi:MAG: hypothetical protein K5697_15295 [Lachnospiraceae bacterium]|nr:hypothetical protein [Lachnospiraceae bacterium]